MFIDDFLPEWLISYGPGNKETLLGLDLYRNEIGNDVTKIVQDNIYFKYYPYCSLIAK